MLVRSICGVFNIERNEEIVRGKLHQVTKLEMLLCSRIEKHIRIRIKDIKKHNHWCLNFSRENIPRVAVAMVYFNHVKEDLDRANENTTLLSHPEENYIRVSDAQESLEECYTYYNKVEKTWIRAGKVAGSDRSDLPCNLKRRNEKNSRRQIAHTLTVMMHPNFIQVTQQGIILIKITFFVADILKI
mmetsp:Transcript_50639/g.99030  ORF Transcript_50639/g.99030 Transcript_50639/m.99030 type:complete len:187 (-) Transcript_50639:342-902(-)